MFVCLSLVEAAVVTYLEYISKHSKQTRDERQEVNLDDFKNNLDQKGLDKEERVELRDINRGEIQTPKVHVIHKVSRALFPLSFFTFNLIYWIYYK